MGIPIIRIIPIMAITLMTTFPSIMISMTFIISIMMVTLIITLTVITLVVILMVVTLMVVMAGEDTHDRRDEGRGFPTLLFWGELEECSFPRPGGEKARSLL
jgi:hypothetical protein